MSRQIKADLCLLTITLVWGVSFVLIRNVLAHIPSFAYLALRFIIASAILLLLYHRKLKLLDTKALLYGLFLSFLLAGGMALQVTGLYYTTASNSAFITALSVVFVPVISALMFKQKPDRYSVIGVILAAIGLYFITGGINFNFNKGDFLTFLSAICFSLQIIYIDKFTEKCDPLLLSILQISFCALIYPVIWFAIDFQTVTFNVTVVYTLIITGALCTALAYTVQTVAQKHTTPTHTAMIFSMEPVFGLFFALIIPDSMGMTEKLTMNTVLGSILIFLGIMASEAKTIFREVRE
ncbi:MAG TPA: DMT family transporter [Clostridiaceae bacterium]|nr:DMT family transporter [Clostridiaceae bacterium]